METYKFWNSEEENLLIKAFTMQSDCEIAKLLGRTKSSVQARARMLGLNKNKTYLRNMSIVRGMPQRSLKRRYSLDEGIFENIDNSSKAYWLGFLWADGSLMRHPRARLALGLAKKDESLLTLFKEFIKTDIPVKYISSNNSVRVVVNSAKIVEDLISHGVVPGKTYISTIPTVNDDFMSHFVRGVFDGDGSVGTSKRNRHRDVFVSVVGSHTMCEWIKVNVSKKLDIGGGIAKYDNYSVWTLRGRTQLGQFAAWIYQGSEYYLERKNNTFKQLGLL